LVAAFGQRLHGRMARQTHAARVHVQAAGQDESIEAIEPGIDVDVLAQRGDDYGQTAGGDDGVQVASAEADKWVVHLAGRHIVGVESDEWPGRMGHRFPSLETRLARAGTRRTCGGSSLRERREYTQRAPNRKDRVTYALGRGWPPDAINRPVRRTRSPPAV